MLRDLFDPVTGIGISYLRLVMGGSDFNAVEPYTYDDISSGTDFTLSQFTIEKDRAFVIPLLKEIRAVSKKLLIVKNSIWKYNEDNCGVEFVFIVNLGN